MLNGHKNWVTNARHADRVIAIARDEQSVAAVIVDPRRPGVSIGEELPRPGMLGVSLAEVTFSGYEFDPDADVLGGRGHDIAESLRGHDMTGYVSRAVGSADAVQSWARGFVRTTIGERPPEARGAIELRLGELSTLVSAMRVVWQAVTGPSPRISPDQAKGLLLHEPAGGDPRRGGAVRAPDTRATTQPSPALPGRARAADCRRAE